MKDLAISRYYGGGKNTPQKVFMTSLNKIKANSMSEKEISEAISKEKSKISLLKKRVRIVKGNLKKKLDKIQEETEDLKKEMNNLYYSRPTNKNLKKAEKLEQRMKNLAKRSERVKVNSSERISELVQKINNTENVINLLEALSIKRLVNKK